MKKHHSMKTAETELADICALRMNVMDTLVSDCQYLHLYISLSVAVLIVTSMLTLQLLCWK